MKQFDTAVEYGAMLAIANRLLKRELVTDEEHRKLTAALDRKYRPIGSQQIFCGNSTPKNYMGENRKGGKI